MSKFDTFGGRLGKEGKQKAQNKVAGVAGRRAQKAMLESRKESKRSIKDFAVNNVIKLEDEDKLPPGKRRGLGRVVEINKEEGVLIVQFHREKLRLKPGFVIKMTDI